jgi:ABC-type multidrug transport system fused ATPase/permease subunit
MALGFFKIKRTSSLFDTTHRELQEYEQSSGLLEKEEIHEAKDRFFGLKYLYHFAEGVRWPMTRSLLLIVLSSVMVMVSARVLGILVESIHQLLQTKSLDPGIHSLGLFVLGLKNAGILNWIAVFLALELFAVILQYFGRVSLAYGTIQLTYLVRCRLFEKIQKLPISYFDAQPLGRTITRVTADVEGLENFFQNTFARVLIALINIIAVLIAMLATDMAFGGLILLFSLPAVAFSLAFRDTVRFWLRSYKRHGAFVNAKLAEYLNGIGVIRLFGLEDWSQRSFKAASLKMRYSGLKIMTWNSILRPIAIFLCSLPTLLILYWGGIRVLESTLSLGALVAFVRLSERFISPIRILSQEAPNIQEALVSGERVRKMLLEQTEEEVLGPDGTLTPQIKGAVEYRNVGMHYPGFSTSVLKDVSFSVKAGMSVGIVGATGSGKTTTMNLLPRFYPFHKGEILVDGYPIQTIKRSHLRSNLGYVYQDTVLTRGTVASNLRELSGRGDLSDAELHQASLKTGLLQVLETYGDGFELTVAESGSNLSMGERQLVALTGVVLRNPRILILDEATAHMNTEIEQLVQRAVLEVMSGWTTFIIAHRLTTIQKCDFILVFHDGAVVEQGSFSELVALKGRFYELVEHQNLQHGN